MSLSNGPRILWLLALSGPGLSSQAALSREDPAALCLSAAAEASSRTGVPYDVLLAISLVETGREARPWPWTVNVAGDGHWFDTADEAAAYVDEVLAQGKTNLDLGCFQLNYRWHAQAFSSADDMLDPARNATYAAEYLVQHYAESGDWALAAAAYHSATPEYAEAYQAKFEATYAGLEGGALPDALPDLPTDRENRFPLLVAGVAASPGSLVPSTPSGLRLIGAP